MIWSNLRKCKIEDIVGYINEKLIELGSLKKIADTLEANESTLENISQIKDISELETNSY